MPELRDPRGSVWHRWDPHIHAPGTLHNDQFKGNWDAYFDAVEAANPRIEALGITDYFSLDTYEELVRRATEGKRLQDVRLIFPNIELRYAIGTKEDKAVNIHLLVSPEDTDHVDKARRFLAKLKFTYGDEEYVCTHQGLTELGYAYDPELPSDRAALLEGVNQFKVTFPQLKEEYNKSAWAKKNILIAVAGSSNDGTAGLQNKENSFAAMRQAIESFSDIVFASQPKQRMFWVGDGVLNRKQLEKKYRSRKPCLHGSDAHDVASIGVTFEGRTTWIKGDLTFEALRQAVLEPAERAVVAKTQPDGALGYQTIESISVSGASWLKTPEIPLNRGLVAVIGARGSGKTALADMIAAGSGAMTTGDVKKSFLYRAKDLLGGTEVKLVWGDDETSSSTLSPIEPEEDEPQAQYLSQQFVEQLCSSEGMTDELLREVERVVFEAHPAEERMATSSFQQLLDRRAQQHRAVRVRANEEISEIATEIERERQLRDGLVALQQERDRLTATNTADKAARSTLLVSGGEARAARLEQITAALTKVRGRIDLAQSQRQDLELLRAEVLDLRDQKLPRMIESLKSSHSVSKLSDQDWKAFNLKFDGDPVSIIDARIVKMDAVIARLVGEPTPVPDPAPQPLPEFVARDADLERVPAAVLNQEEQRLRAAIGLDERRAQQLKTLNDKVAAAETRLTKLASDIKTAEGADARLKTLRERRRVAYASVFDGFAGEQAELERLYAPLKAVLKDQKGALASLTFKVRRVVDVAAWTARGERLFDLRKGLFHGKGDLEKVATDELLPAWRNGNSAAVATAMNSFRATYDSEIVKVGKFDATKPGDKWRWGAEVSDWLTSTDHITVEYAVQYQGVDIEQLSPGTRGIVLLLLYLSLDQNDTRPIIIDQPEENLDPKSIFDELVWRFQEARHRRQIIIVTHNANLVVNTDADQVIVANAGSHKQRELPAITYYSGGLEDPRIQAEVCNILEGGREAFRERARRLNMKEVVTPTS